MASKRAASEERARASVERKRQKAHALPRPLPTISIIGTGRLGTALALSLSRCGYTIESVVARRKSHARRVAPIISARTLALASSELGSLPSSDLLLITTPDDKIREVAAQIAATIKEKHAAKRTALHMSGALSSNELKGLRDVGFSIGSMHPLVSVSDSRTGAERLPRAFFCIEGEPKAVRLARKLVRHLGARSFSIKTKDKALYHAAAVTSSGHMVALFDIATEMLTRCGLSAKEARAVLLPLLLSTVDNLSEQEPARALTGTFARADAETVRRHLSAIQRENLTDALAAYTLLGARSLQLAKKRGAERDAIALIACALAEVMKDKS